MVSKNRVKDYVAGGYYHVYNRGVNKMNIFTDRQDEGVLLSYMKAYLMEKDEDKLKDLLDKTESEKEKEELRKKLDINNFYSRIDLVAYCLMSNHYHFLLRQTDVDDMISFMKSLMTRYSQYFNKRHDRVGPLFQGRYKAVLVESEEQLLHLSRYIHLNPVGDRLGGTDPWIRLRPSSYPNYLREINQTWVKPEVVLNYFVDKGEGSYQEFVEHQDTDLDEQTLMVIRSLTVD